ncbi:MAG: CatA-like O-acetyltransferase [Kiloniellales bacterium]
MRSRTEHFAFFESYDDPTLNIVTQLRCADFIARAKEAGQPPFAWCLHALARASLEIENFRWRVADGEMTEVRSLFPSWTVRGVDDNVNFVSMPYMQSRDAFVDLYRRKRDEAVSDRGFRPAPLRNRDYLFVTCLPFLSFSALDHPIGRYKDASIPNIAVGLASPTEEGELIIPLGVQAHHGLVDGIHIKRYLDSVAQGLSS